MAEKSLEDRIKEAELAKQEAETAKLIIEGELVRKQVNAKWYAGQSLAKFTGFVLTAVALYSVLDTAFLTDIREHKSRLIKLQAENGANQSYRKASAHLQALTGKGRKINNRNRIRRTTNEVGKLLEQKTDQKQTVTRLTHRSKDEAYASELNVVVDGGHVHDANNCSQQKND